MVIRVERLLQFQHKHIQLQLVQEELVELLQMVKMAPMDQIQFFQLYHLQVVVLVAKDQE
tara:strand:+ start:168 stop:347 length:180 start_codon:yes stop_codon:yes gene_type:complete